jgi:hypothetical protein
MSERSHLNSTSPGIYQSSHHTVCCERAPTFLGPSTEFYSSHALPFQHICRLWAASYGLIPGKSSCILQDHAGCWHRHGSPNIDREWTLGATDKQIKEEREKRLDSGAEREPIRCPNCGGIRGVAGTRPPDICPHCGHRHVKSVRLVRMTDGTLTKKIGNARKKKKPPDPDVDAWRSCLYAAINGRRPMTVEQVAAWFYRKTGRSLPDGLLGTPPRGDVRRQMFVKDVFQWLEPRRARAA